MSIASVVIDRREPEWVQKLSFGGAPVSIDLIETDVLVLTDDGTLLGIERKSSTDFLSTLRADRLFPQLQRLRELTPWSYLAICGELRPGPQGNCIAEGGRETGWTWESVQGALLTCQEIGVHVVSCREMDFEQTMIRLANRERGALRVRPPRETSVMSDGEQLLCALPGIGPEKAAALMAYCGTAAWALTYLTEPITPEDRDEWGEGPAGIGIGAKRRVRAALGLDAETCLHVMYDAGLPARFDREKERCRVSLPSAT